MSDIASTFRSYALNQDGTPRSPDEVIPVRVGLLLEAAAENERLTIEVEAAKKFGDGFYGEKVTEGVREVYRGFARAALSGDKQE